MISDSRARPVLVRTAGDTPPGGEGPRDRKDAVESVAAYKTILRDVLDNRPSGTRQRLATALGKNRSFISQISNPVYAVPIPAQHVETIFEVCHFAPRERKLFLAAYARAHSGRRGGPLPSARTRSLTVTVPDLGDPGRNAAFDEMLLDVARRIARTFEDPGS